MGSLLSALVGINFQGIQYSGSTFSVISMLGLLLLLAIFCRFLICTPHYILGSFCILVYHGLLI